MEIGGSTTRPAIYPTPTANEAGGTTVLGEGVRGIQNASEGLLNAAKTIASAATSNSNAEAPSNFEVANALIDQRQNQTFFDASAKVVSVADELAGKIIDEIV